MSAIKRTPTDKAASDLVREAADYVCARCHFNFRHNPGYFDNCHYDGRQQRCTRWNLLNLLPMCRSCHSATAVAKAEFTELMFSYHGADWFDRLRAVTIARKKITKADEKDICAHLKNEHKRVLALRKEGVTGRIEISNYEGIT